MTQLMDFISATRSATGLQFRVPHPTQRALRLTVDIILARLAFLEIDKRRYPTVLFVLSED